MWRPGKVRFLIDVKNPYLLGRPRPPANAPLPGPRRSPDSQRQSGYALLPSRIRRRFLIQIDALPSSRLPRSSSLINGRSLRGNVPFDAMPADGEVGGEGTIAETHGSDENARIPAVRGTTIEPLRSTQSRPSAPAPRALHDAPNRTLPEEVRPTARSGASRPSTMPRPAARVVPRASRARHKSRLLVVASERPFGGTYQSPRRCFQSRVPDSRPIGNISDQRRSTRRSV
jgi:hypothetical protein